MNGQVGICKRPGCGKEISAKRVAGSGFCSFECSVLHSIDKVIAAQENATGRQDTGQSQKFIPGTAPVGFDTHSTGQEWQRAAQNYEAIARGYLDKERRDTGKRSIILAGRGANLKVERDCLVITYGVTHQPQELIREEICRAVHETKRIIWCAATGNVSFNALKWMQDQEIDFVCLDRDGTVVCQNNVGIRPDIVLRRLQYLMLPEKRMGIARWLIQAKIENQLATYKLFPNIRSDRADGAFEAGASWFSLNPPPDWMKNVKALTLFEGRVARAYFEGWRDVELDFYRKEMVPSHWLTFGDRTSPLGNSHWGETGRAVTPGNAILNYVYGVLEHATRTALLAVGFDTYAGVVHYDKPDRESLIYDLMEVARGDVDAKVLRFIERTKFHVSDFVKTPTGQVRCDPQLARAVVAACGPDSELLERYAKELKEKISG